MDVETAKAVLVAAGYRVTLPKPKASADEFAKWFDKPLRGNPGKGDEIGASTVRFEDGAIVTGNALKLKQWLAGAAARASCDRYRYRQARVLGVPDRNIDEIFVPQAVAMDISGLAFDPAILNAETFTYRQPASNRFANNF